MLTFAIASYAEDLDYGEDDKEDSDPDANVDAAIGPEIDRKSSGSDLEGKDGEPLDCIIPAHGETPAKFVSRHEAQETPNASVRTKMGR